MDDRNFSLTTSLSAVVEERKSDVSPESVQLGLMHDIEGMEVDLRPYVNTSAHCLTEGFSVKSAFSIFRANGLRHLFVLNNQHEVVGICTRKNFVMHNMVHALPDQPDTITRPTAHGSTPRPKCPLVRRWMAPA